MQAVRFVRTFDTLRRPFMYHSLPRCRMQHPRLRRQEGTTGLKSPQTDSEPGSWDETAKICDGHLVVLQEARNSLNAGVRA